MFVPTVAVEQNIKQGKAGSFPLSNTVQKPLSGKVVPLTVYNNPTAEGGRKKKPVSKPKKKKMTSPKKPTRK